MRFNCGPTYEEIETEEKWHKWFAWYPVRFWGGNDYRWLEVVEKRGISHGGGPWVIEYREITKEVEEDDEI